MELRHGIRPNLNQFLLLLMQVLLVGLTLGMTRTVVPALAESDFGVPRNSFLLLTSFVVAFGLVKGTSLYISLTDGSSPSKKSFTFKHLTRPL